VFLRLYVVSPVFRDRWHLAQKKKIKYIRANVAKNQTSSQYCGNSSKINSAHILMLGRHVKQITA